MGCDSLAHLQFVSFRRLGNVGPCGDGPNYFGEAAVVALARWDDLAGGYVVIRDPLVVRLYSAYFDLTWRHAAPVPTGRDRTSLKVDP